MPYWEECGSSKVHLALACPRSTVRFVRVTASMLQESHVSFLKSIAEYTGVTHDLMER